MCNQQSTSPPPEMSQTHLMLSTRQRGGACILNTHALGCTDSRTRITRTCGGVVHTHSQATHSTARNSRVRTLTRMSTASGECGVRCSAKWCSGWWCMPWHVVASARVQRGSAHHRISAGLPKPGCCTTAHGHNNAKKAYTHQYCQAGASDEVRGGEAVMGPDRSCQGPPPPPLSP